MKNGSLFRHRMHVMHDDGIREMHYTGQLLHDKYFWSIVTILGYLAILITLAVLFSEFALMDRIDS